MAGPWDKYKTQENRKPSSGAARPWEKFGSEANVPPGLSAAEAGAQRIGTVTPEPGKLGEAVLGGLEFIETKTGAPARAAVGSVMRGGGLSDALSAAGEQFLSSDVLPTTPRGADIVKPIFGEGVGAEVAGFATELLLDPTIVLSGPATRVLKGAIGGSTKAASKVGGAIKRGTKKIASELTGTPEKDIEILNKLGKNYFEKLNNFTAAGLAEDARMVLNNSIEGFVNTQNAQISKTINNLKNVKNVDPKKITDVFDNTISKLDPVADKETLAVINKEYNAFKTIIQDGKIKPGELWSFTNRFKRLSKPNLQAKIGDESTPFFKKLAAVSNRVVGREIPVAKQSLENLSKLRSIQRKITGLTDVTRADRAIVEAGRGVGKQGKLLNRLEDILGPKIRQPFEEASAASSFADPSLLPQDATGKSLTRLVIGGGIGTLAGGGGPLGLALGAAATSPAALKQAIKANVAVRSAVRSVTGLAKKATPKEIDMAVRTIAADPELQRKMLLSFNLSRRASENIKGKQNERNKR